MKGKSKPTPWLLKPVNRLQPNGALDTPYTSLTASAKANYLTPHGMAYRIQTGKVYDGYRYEYAETAKEAR